jgi:formate hydrogenlyase transcriptional activator
MDENNFFRQVTIRICGNLDIEKALLQCLSYLKQTMPVDIMLLYTHDRDIGGVRTIASAPASGDKKLGSLTDICLKAAVISERTEAQHLTIFNSSELDPVSRQLTQDFGTSYPSVLIMPLSICGERVGGLAVVAVRKERFSEIHTRLLSFLNEPFAIALSNTLRYHANLKLKDILADEKQDLHPGLPAVSRNKIVGADHGLKGVMEMVQKVAPLETPVLLLGETGVGKEVIANAIHSLSPRRDRSFIPVNCGAMPETLLNTELFGHEKGAFTGAIAQKRGCFELANRGTIFLDEIGELIPQAQIRMLRVLQNKEVVRVGGSRPISVDIRIIAATNRDLAEMVRTNQFRKDLWFRFNVFPIAIPPLRDRKQDIPALMQHYVKRKSAEQKLRTPPLLAPGAIGRLISYSWPGNVRELENVVERALILNNAGPLKFERSTLRPPGNEAKVFPAQEGELQKLDDAISMHIQRAMKKAEGRIHGSGGAAELLGINPSTLRYKMDRLKIPYGRNK